MASINTIKIPSGTSYDLSGKTVTVSSTSASTSYYIVGSSATSSTTASLYANSNIYFNPNSGVLTSKTFNASSDARLKENIKPYSCTESILDLPIYIYDFKGGSLNNQIGCLAQDLQKICPEIVTKGEDGYLSIQESKIVFLLLQELKKQNARIDELEKKLGESE